jgi:lysophospholipase L1-like esterase
MKRYTFGTVLVFALIAIGLVAANQHSKPQAPNEPHNSYVALGDSVAAGVGLEDYSDSSACDRTNESYPNLVAAKLNLKLKNFACSGATLPAGILGEQDVNQLMVAPQLDQLFSQPRPYLITITIGANDTQWTTFIAKCYAGECGSAEDSAAVNELLATVSVNLQNTLSQIQSHYKTAVPHVVVTGYHHVFPAGPTTCSDLSDINASELAWGRQQQTNLNNSTAHVVAEFSFAKFAAIDFSGHELCTTDAWVQGIGGNAPYHPTDEGQAAYARQIVSTVQSFK